MRTLWKSSNWSSSDKSSHASHVWTRSPGVREVESSPEMTARRIPSSGDAVVGAETGADVDEDAGSFAGVDGCDDEDVGLFDEVIAWVVEEALDLPARR